VAARSTESGHRIKFNETETLAKTPGYMGRFVREAVEMNFYPVNINRMEDSNSAKQEIPAPVY
jgi:hypothetical protein